MTIRLFFSASLRKKVSHKGAKARSRKMLRIFLCAFESLWLNSIFYKIEFQPFKILVISSLWKGVDSCTRFRQSRLQSGLTLFTGWIKCLIGIQISFYQFLIYLIHLFDAGHFNFSAYKASLCNKQHYETSVTFR